MSCSCNKTAIIASAAATYSGGVPMNVAGTIVTSDITGLPAGTCEFGIAFRHSWAGTAAYVASNSTASNASNTAHNHILYQYIADNFPNVGGTTPGYLAIAADNTGSLGTSAFGCPCGTSAGLFIFRKFRLLERYVLGGSIMGNTVVSGSWTDIITYLQGEGFTGTVNTSWSTVRAWIEDSANLPNLTYKINSSATLATGANVTGENDVLMMFINSGATCPTPPGPLPCTGAGYTTGNVLFGCTGINLSNESAPGANDGSVSVTPIGGFAPYTYSWINTNTNAVVGTTQTVTGLPGLVNQGIWYEVTVTDTKGCETICTVNVLTIGVPTNPCEQVGGLLDALQATCTKTDENYTGSADGTATSVVTWTPNVGLGSWQTVTFTYTWYNSSGGAILSSTGGTPPTGLTATGLTAGTYNFEVVASFIFNELQQRCIANCSVIIGIKTPPDPCITNPVTVAITNSIAPTSNTTGSITVAPGSGTAPYSYQWTYPNGTTVNTQNITGLTIGGLYTVTITDANECEDTADVTFPKLPAGTIGPPCCEDNCILDPSVQEILTSIKECYGELACQYSRKICLGQDVHDIFRRMMVMFLIIDFIETHNNLLKNCDITGCCDSDPDAWDETVTYALSTTVYYESEAKKYISKANANTGNLPIDEDGRSNEDWWVLCCDDSDVISTEKNCLNQLILTNCNCIDRDKSEIIT